MTQPLRIAIAGALGRMGGQMVEAVAADPRLELAARFHRPGSSGEGLVPRDEALALADVVIDFTTPSASVELAKACAARGGPALVIGSTGFNASELAAMAEAARKVAVVRSGSYSLGLNMLIGLVETVRAIPERFRRRREEQSESRLPAETGLRSEASLRSETSLERG